MTIYIEPFLINNMALNSVILYITALITKRVPIWWQILLSAIVGAVYALLSPLIPHIIEVPLKIILSLVMCIISTRYVNIKEFSIYTAVFYLVTFALGGAVMGFANIFSPLRQAIYAPHNINFACVILLGMISCVVARIVLQRAGINKRHNFQSQVTVTTNQGNYTALGYLDSGNTAYYKGIYPIIAVSNLALPKACGKLKVKTITDTIELPVYAIKRLQVEGKTYRNVYAIPQLSESQYPIILHSSMI